MKKQVSVTKAINTRFKPEFLNRIDHVVHFKPLLEEEIKSIFKLRFDEVVKRLSESRNITTTIKPDAIAYICSKGYDPLMGVRPLNRAIERYIMTRITEHIIGDNIHAGDTIVIDTTDLK